MPYISNTDAERHEMLSRIGVGSFDELIKAIPETLRLKEPLKLPKPMSELEITRLIQGKTCRNVCVQNTNSFLGAGVYDHFIPAAVDSIVSRPEFFTAYTPYQAEVSQGTLQFIYEYQTMICELTGMGIANASMYDGASAIAEAILMAVRKNRLMKAILPATLHPEYVKVIKIYTEGIGVELLTAPAKNGIMDVEALAMMMDDSIGSVVIQSPNFFGNLEPMHALEKIIHAQPKALFIAACDPIALAILKSPGELGADIVVGEGQALGNSMYMGGPLFGFFATKLDMARLMPGRIVGGTLDAEGKRAYALTLQAREQHIRRDKATSNICSNQSLCTLAATVYLALIGREGLKEVATQSAQKAHYLATELAKCPGCRLAYPDTPFFKEFVLQTPIPAAKIIDSMLPRGIFPGVDMSRFGHENQLMIAVTEKKSKAEIDELIGAMKEVCHV
ncbi:MAG: aminomethyl-transferring glycine dehydrogenase subunit GcvPA [Candidatus Cloacimonadaceae bacterium]|nr:aminomethyl-transferring glycine dehydrogenase subunit GcvPA [Candidatus Cloacimonadaceae bacterium]